MKESLDNKSIFPERPLEDAPVFLSESERHRLLVEWNRTAANYPQDKTIHELFEAQVEQTPDAVALVFEGGKLTYRELNGRANQLAHHLRKLGIGPEKLVGLFMERSLELVVGLLGILKAGGAYLPMDPKYPQERVEFMLADAQPQVILTQVSLRERLPAGCGEIVLLDKQVATAPIFPVNPSSGDLRPQTGNLAYVIFTSGSTGKPKGVAIEHRSVVNFIYWGWEVFTDEEMAGVLAGTSICFDLSVFELFVTLSRGGKVILVESVLQLSKLSGWDQVTLINTVPSTMAELIKSGELPENVQVVNLAGEPLATSLVDKIYAAGNVEKVNDLYGPTETTTYSTFTLRKRGRKPTIGRPIANTQLYILDKNLEPVPIGVAGELHIGGAGLARGYLNRPELTAEKFIRHPFSDEPGARLYKTGDLCRYLPDGNIEYLGRMDQQVKIRGFRIELGEIEAVLGGHPAVRESVVVAREDVPGEKTLVAYLVVREGLAPTVTELREFLLKQLPDYMVPAAFVELAQLPLTPNGKIDRKALPAPAANRLGSGLAYVAPRTPTEAALAAIWGELLGLKQVGIHENFFALGGHSLLAVKMVDEIKKQMKFDLPLRRLFQQPTIFELAKLLQNNNVKDRRPELIQLNAGRLGAELYLLIDEGSLGLFKLAHQLDKDQPLYASVVPLTESILKASAKKQMSALPSMEDWAAEHVALIRSRHPVGPILLAGHCFGGVLAFEVARQLQAAGVPVQAVLLLDTWMARMTFWWEKKAWIREHFGRLLKQGPSYLWSKSSRRIRLEKKELTSRLKLATHSDFNLRMPWAIIARIYRKAMKDYRPTPLASHGILFVSREDWLANAYRPLDDSLGAGKMFSNGVEVIEVPGNHVTILNEEHLPELARQFNKCLEQFR
jgi:amino acid adenylation domain-containing protein